MMTISSLIYVKNYITQELHDSLVQNIDSMPWLTDLKRRTQHYGYKYDYTAKRIDASFKTDPIPKWAQILPTKPDQLIVNEYQPGQGIAQHIDCVPCFKDVITSISLLNPCIMEFINKNTKEKVELLLEPRSLLCLNKESRYDWTHGIPARKQDVFEGITYPRERRISLTFRKVILS